MWFKKKRGQKQSGFKIRFVGEHGASLTMSQTRDCLVEAARRLQQYQDGYRIKRAALYLTVIDADGDEVYLVPEGEWTINAYASAADEFDA